MDRREMLGMLGAGAVGMAAFGGHAVAGDDDKHAHAGHDCDKCETMAKDCLKACAECAMACDEAFHHCLMEVSKGKKESGWTLQMVGDCGMICGVSAGMIARHSPLMDATCHACAHACEKTIAHVEKHGGDDAKELVAKLQACHKSCKAMVEHMHEAHKAKEGKEKA